MKSSKLKILDISAKRRYNSTKPTDITKLVRALRHIDTVEEFNVSRRMLSGYESVIECAKLLKRSKCLKKLDLFASQYSNNCRIHPDAWTYMGKALPRTDSLQNLDISFHRLSEASWKALGEGLKVNTSLLTLKAWKRCDLRYDKETNILLPVFDALHENRTLESLSLNGYDLSDSITALEVLESALIQNTSLKSLQIEESAMTDEGVAILSRSLPQMKSIEELDLEHHGCSLNGAQAFAKGIKNNYNLLSVGLGTRCRLHRSMYGTPIEAEGFAKEWHEVQYYARMNRRGRRCIGSKSPIQPPLWPLVLANAMKKEEQDPSEILPTGSMAVSRLAKKVLRIRPARKNRRAASSSGQEVEERPRITPNTKKKDPAIVVAEQVKDYLTALYRSEGDVEFQFPGNIMYGIVLQCNETMDGHCLLSSHFSVQSKFGNACSGSIEIHAKEVGDILRVLNWLKISSFELDFVEHAVCKEQQVIAKEGGKEAESSIQMELVQEDYYMHAVKDFLCINPSLRKLSILENFLRQDQELVCDVLRSSKSLSTLEISHRALTEEEILEQSLNEYIALVPECQCLQKLILTKVKNLSPTTIQVIADVLAKDSTLKVLDLSNGFSGEEPFDVLKIAQALNGNSTLEELDLGKRVLANDGCIRALAETIETNTCLKRLELGFLYFGNDLISPDAWVPMGNALANKSNTVIEYLDISNHQLSESSWKALAEGLKSNTSLLTLVATRPYSEKNKENTETDMLLPIFEMLHENTTLRSLHLTGYNLSDSFHSLESLAMVLSEGNRSLKSLKLNGSYLTDQGVTILSQGLPKWKGLEHLDLNHHNFSLLGAQAFAKGMQSNYSLISVGVGQTFRHGFSTGCVPPLSAEGFEKEYHEIQYYAKLNRKGRRCWTKDAPLDPSAWSLVLARATRMQAEDQPLGRHHLCTKDVREEDKFAGSHDTSIDAVYFLLRNVMTLPVDL
ncbi:unnamed protein product [Cylindrotheca closterium]|uniref:Uncharacterized protein n=1 Tax=Cylindrotheca closterium TaxID=2856 RepID=A0AAD2CGF2_9STRA|nr:unnamed protein product [Cylindrotheca closterium]